MNQRRANDEVIGMDECVGNLDLPETTLSKKLERRRRIEDIFEERKLQEELGDLDLL